MLKLSLLNLALACLEFERNIITVDLLLCRPSGHGDTYSFKVKKEGMPLLFPKSAVYVL